LTRALVQAVRALLAGAVALCLALPAAHAQPAQPAQPPQPAHSTQAAEAAVRTPQRIVSLVPSLTETVCSLGACSRLVGTDRFANWPPSVLQLPKLGGLDDAQVESIVALRPDLVLAAPSARVVRRLRDLGLTVQVFASDSHADVRRSIDALAATLGDAAAGPRLWAAIERELAAARDRVPPAWRGQRVYFEVSTTPHAAGTGSFIGQTLAGLGLANIVPPALGAFPQLSPEFIVRAQPDVVMAPRREISAMAARPGWAALQALGHDRHCGFDAAGYEMLVRPGPRLGEAAGLIADCLVALESRR